MEKQVRTLQSVVDNYTQESSKHNHDYTWDNHTSIANAVQTRLANIVPNGRIGLTLPEEYFQYEIDFARAIDCLVYKTLYSDEYKQIKRTA